MPGGRDRRSRFSWGYVLWLAVVVLVIILVILVVLPEPVGALL